jgi:hypothetical protein
LFCKLGGNEVSACTKRKTPAYRERQSE